MRPCGSFSTERSRRHRLVKITFVRWFRHRRRHHESAVAVRIEDWRFGRHFIFGVERLGGGCRLFKGFGYDQCNRLAEIMNLADILGWRLARRSLRRRRCWATGSQVFRG